MYRVAGAPRGLSRCLACPRARERGEGLNGRRVGRGIEGRETIDVGPAYRSVFRDGHVIAVPQGRTHLFQILLAARPVGDQVGGGGNLALSNDLTRPERHFDRFGYGTASSNARSREPSSMRVRVPRPASMSAITARRPTSICPSNCSGDAPHQGQPGFRLSIRVTTASRTPSEAVAPKRSQHFLDAGRVLDRAVVQRLTDAGQPFSGGHAKTEREPEAGICIAVKGNDLPALARKASGENGGDNGLARAALADNRDLHDISSNPLTRWPSPAPRDCGATSMGAMPRRSASARSSS